MGRQTMRPRRNARSARVVGKATMQLLETRLLFAGNTFDVTNFGAHPNDGLDDWTAIQAAITVASSGDTIYFPAGVYNVLSFVGTGGNGKLITKSGLTFLGETAPDPNNANTPLDLATLSGHDSLGPLIHFNTDGMTFSHMTFSGGGLFFDKSGSYNANILIDNCVFDIDTGGSNHNAITSTVGLRNTTISNNYFTENNYNGGFGIYGYGRDHLTVNNNLFINMSAGIHMQSFSASDSNAVFDENYFIGDKGMGIELQQYGINTVVQDNWYEHPNLSSTASKNSNSMAYSIILDQSTGTIVQRNVVIAPERPDGIGTRIGIEIGGDNALVQDNYMNGVNQTVAANDANGTESVTVQNNQFSNYLEGVAIHFPSNNPLRTMVASNNGPNVVLTWSLSRGIPQRNVRYGVPTSPPPPPPPPDSPPPPPPPPPPTVPNAPSNLSGTVTPGLNQINFTWQDNSSDETDFVVQMLADDGVTWVSIASLPQNVTTYTLSNVAAGKTYNFRVLAHNGVGYSDASSPTIVTTPLADLFTAATVTTASRRTAPSLISAGTAVAPPQTATS